jgi:hypothetical protein
MSEVIPYTQETHSETQGMSVKEKIGYTLLAGLALATTIHFGVKLYKKNIANKSDAKSFQDGNPETIAKQIKLALTNKFDFGANVDGLRQILTKIKSKAQMEEVRIEYSKQFHSPLYSDISSKLKLSEYNEMVQIMEGKPEKTGQVPTSVQYKAWAKRLKSAFDKKYTFVSGTDEAAIRAVFNEVPTQRAFINVGIAYYKEYKENVMTVLKSELEVWEYPTYMKILTDKPKG